MADIVISLPDGSLAGVPAGPPPATSPRRSGLAWPRPPSPRVDGEEWDLARPLPDGAKVEIITADSRGGRHVLRHSTAHVMAQAVTQLYPGAKYTIGPAIEDGFYYDFDLPEGKTFHEDDLAAIEARMREIIAADQPFFRAEVSADDALADVRRPAVQARDHRAVSDADADESDSARSTRARRSASTATLTEFVDLCRGPHVPSTGGSGTSS